ncbi:amidohydrolase [Flavihumibacter stibioxidans]|uniref:Amidohydrolase n=1 Tax=Flavihumibacter stibioxidans TaxID=1834163 RepID=A0ABR7MAW7_9BACT|nr:amidohydrolase [Flavihumibacter stibioxidans]MBC6492185.1 amidohydrolase [Flavihumibacter stibioxidans]
MHISSPGRTLLPALLILVSGLFTACTNPSEADLLVQNAVIYTVDSSFSMAQAMAIKDGKILAIGSNAEIQAAYKGKETIDAGGKFIYPGFIDAHAHFYSYGLGLQTADLVGTDSWNAILDSLQSFAATHPEGWLIGRGWDQNDWSVKEYPGNADLNRLFPNRPVLLSRVDGHAAIANNKALELAGIKPGDKLTGGDIEVVKGKLTGILIDNAIGLVSAKIPAPDAAQMKAALLDAQANCVAMGLTTVDDCGLDYEEVIFIDSIQKAGDLKMRVFAMLSDAKKNYDYIFSRGKIKTDRLNVRAFKVYADGALGSRGACLLEPYSDKPGQTGFLLSNPEHFDSVAALLIEKQFQMCTHAIGDSGNRTILHTYAKYLKGKNDLRWRIEHAQVVNAADFKLFGENSVIPSVQPTHATSDMYWAGERLGKEREKGAYAFNDLMKQNGWIALGTDFPVEDISPFKTFLASAIRKDAKGYPENGYQVENALSRENTLRGMTIWAAKSNFEEDEKGSLEKGKLADFIMLDRDLMKVAPGDILNTRVLATWIGGESVYKR